MASGEKRENYKFFTYLDLFFLKILLACVVGLYAQLRSELFQREKDSFETVQKEAIVDPHTKCTNYDEKGKFMFQVSLDRNMKLGKESYSLGSLMYSQILRQIGIFRYTYEGKTDISHMYTKTCHFLTCNKKFISYEFCHDCTLVKGLERLDYSQKSNTLVFFLDSMKRKSQKVTIYFAISDSIKYEFEGEQYLKILKGQTIFHSGYEEITFDCRW